MPDIKDVGTVAQFVRWGNPHHGLLDGTTLADGGAGVSHPTLRAYEQRTGLWVTPVFRVRVPGHTAPDLPAPAPGATWLDYGLVSGTQMAFYRTNLAPLPQYRAWMVSFGVGDTWRVGIVSSSISVSAGGGSASVTVSGNRFASFNGPEDGVTSMSVSASLSPIGQPEFSGGVDDFFATDLILRPLDISEDGQRILLGIMPSVVGYNGFNSPRGILLLTITRTTATLELFKARSDMLVSVTKSTNTVDNGTPLDLSCAAPGTLTRPGEDYVTTQTWNTSRTLGAYFDNDGVARPITESVSTVQTLTVVSDSWQQTCSTCSSGQFSNCSTPDGQTVTNDSVLQLEQTVTLGNGASTIATASYTETLHGEGSSTSAGGSFSNTGTLGSSSAHTQLSTRVYNASGSVSYDATVTGTPEKSYWSALVVSMRYALPIESLSAPDGSFVRSPWEFNNTLGNFVIGQITFGTVAHFATDSLEYSVFHARTQQGGYVVRAPEDSSANNAIISVHPETGETAAKRGSWSTAPPSFGWV